MLKKILLVFNTVRFLKGRQIFYQLYYRLKPKHSLDKYRPKAAAAGNFIFLKFSHQCQTAEAVAQDGAFTFLNLQKNFGDTIDWNYQGYGKLWNYNLQYFNYLHQDSLAGAKKLAYLNDISSWLKDGRLKLEPYPVSLRIMNVIRYLSESSINQPEVIEDIYGQLNYLNQHIEYHLLGNHVLENGFALLMGGSFFKIKAVETKAKKLLRKELDEQTLGDGGHFELSPMYHQIILFRVLELIDWYRNPEDRDQQFLMFAEQKAVKMLGWLNKMSFKCGDIPHFNDSADGIAYSTWQLNQFAAELGLAASENQILADSGYRKFASAKCEFVADVGPIGPSYQPGHSHADALSFVLYVNDAPVIVDTGTSTYQIGEQRSAERSTAAHNTVVVGNTNQSQVWGGFRVGQRAETKILVDSDGHLSASHDGYKKAFGVVHQRDFVFDSDSITINDKLEGNDGLTSTLFLHFHPDRIVTINAENLIIIDNIALIYCNTPAKLKLGKYQHATGFNLYREASSVVVDFCGNLSLVIKLL